MEMQRFQREDMADKHSDGVLALTNLHGLSRRPGSRLDRPVAPASCAESDQMVTRPRHADMVFV